MAIKAFSEETHIRTHRVLIDHKDLHQILATAAADKIESFPKPKIGSPGTTYKVAFEEATEGSPPYRVGTKVTVTIIENLGDLPE